MARSLGEGIISGLKNYTAFNQTGQTKQMNDLKMLATMQQLKAMNTPGLVYSPKGYFNPEVEKAKQNIAVEAMQNYMGGGVEQGQPTTQPPTLGPSLSVNGQTQEVPQFLEAKTWSGGKPGLRQFPNPAIPKPLNALQQAQLAEKEQKIKDAEKLKVVQEESLKSSAQDAIKSIETIKKGSKYFGPLGELPSFLAPSSVIPGEYGKRAEWEANINNVLSKKVIEVMNNMKRVSKTGATGFGQLNRSELELLKSASTILNKKLSPDIAEKYLNDLENINKKIIGKNNVNQIPEFNTEAEAEASGFKGEVIISGKRALIE